MKFVKLLETLCKAHDWVLSYNSDGSLRVDPGAEPVSIYPREHPGGGYFAAFSVRLGPAKKLISEAEALLETSTLFFTHYSINPDGDLWVMAQLPLEGLSQRILSQAILETSGVAQRARGALKTRPLKPFPGSRGLAGPGSIVSKRKRLPTQRARRERRSLKSKRSQMAEALGQQITNAAAAVAHFTCESVKSGAWFSIALGDLYDQALRGQRSDIREMFSGKDAEEAIEAHVRDIARVAMGLAGLKANKLTIDDLEPIEKAESGGSTPLPEPVADAFCELYALLRLQVVALLEIADVYGKSPNKDELIEIVHRGLDLAAKSRRVRKTPHRTKLSREALLSDSGKDCFVGREIYRRAVLKTAIPGVRSSLLKGFYCFFSKSVNQVAGAVFSGKAIGSDDVSKKVEQNRQAEGLMLPSILCMAMADGELSDAERQLFHTTFQKLDLEEEEKGQVLRSLNQPKQEILRQVRHLASSDQREVFFEAMVGMALADGKLDQAEEQFLEEVGALLDMDFDSVAIRARLHEMHR